ncbi:alanine dehydrogenase [Accumulibacter sp.]|uniref:alanine dehydrogenase n=1 Tax=Accumulibacter sp. TaxID=2053492 RepID=UPI0025EC2193|nr:alanine dehydrogenase [Accumulibacter sp.]MCM8596682.1 alanine dehydrogenase [Accumulibacter sp.]MCM8627650.1 alanine dehydrogenase [Accumulibacter sp.]MDS4050830.1 alanine dehydrogenase [Accumulibacter sp.]
MHVGVPREIKNHEYRVGLTPSSVREMVAHGHRVSVEAGAGRGIGATDEVYEKAGAIIVGSAEEIFATAEMIVKVKEPQAGERAMLREGQVLYTYLHLAPDPEQCADLVRSGAVCIAYETVTQPGGGLPLLAPMSEVAGRLSVQAGAHCLEKAHGGMGILLGGVAGVPPAKIVILGGGVVGTNAAQMAAGSGAQVVIIDRSLDVLRRIEAQFGARVITVYSNRDNVEHHVLRADLVIGGVLIPGAAAPKLITRQMVEAMKPGSVIVDVAIDQGGCSETAHATTHTDPTYLVGHVVHYCVANMPGSVPRTSTYALNNATLPFALQIADQGWRQALHEDAHLRNGLNVAYGQVTCREVAEALGYDHRDPLAVIGG